MNRRMFETGICPARNGLTLQGRAELNHKLNESVRKNKKQRKEATWS
jgi:hypothetical protein